MQTVRLTRDQAARKMLAAHEAGRLSAQAPAWPGTAGTNGRATYFTRRDDRNYRCAVGQLFTEEDAARLEREQDVYLLAQDLLLDGVIELEDGPEAGEWLVQAQQLHDSWASAVDNQARNGGNPASLEREFLEHVRAGLSPEVRVDNTEKLGE